MADRPKKKNSGGSRGGGGGGGGHIIINWLKHSYKRYCKICHMYLSYEILNARYTIIQIRLNDTKHGEMYQELAVLLILLMLTLQNHEFVGRQQHRSNAHDQEDATEGYYRINITIPFPDHLLSEFENRQSIFTSHLYSQISKHTTLF